MASPALSADQPQTFCSHSTIESSIAPNAVANIVIASEAPEKLRTRNSAGWTSGLARPGAVHGEQAEQYHGAGQGGNRPGRAPAPGAPLHQPERQRPDSGRHQDRAQGVRPGHRVPGHVGQLQPAHHQGRHADGHVDQEHPAPAGGDEQAPDHRAEGRGQAADRRPGPYCAAPPLGRVRGEHQAQGGRCEQGRACRLDQPERHQHRHAGGGRAGRGRRGEDRHAQQEAVVPPVPVGQPAEEHQQRRVHDRVAVQHPGQLAQAGVAEVVGDLGQRHVHDEQVQAGQDHSRAHDGQHQAGPGVAGAASGGRGVAAGSAGRGDLT